MQRLNSIRWRGEPLSGQEGGADAGNQANLVLGWSSFWLSKSPTYQEALHEAATRGNLTSATQDALCAAAHQTADLAKRTLPLLAACGSRSRL